MLLFQSKERGETSIVEGKPGCRMGESECMNRSNSEAEHGRRHWVGYASSSTAQHSAARWYKTCTESETAALSDLATDTALGIAVRQKTTAVAARETRDSCTLELSQTRKTPTRSE